MKLRYKLTLAMLIVAALPLAIAGVQGLGYSSAAVEERIREILAKTSRAEAEIIGRDMEGSMRSLSLLALSMSVDTESLSGVEDKLKGVYLLSNRFNAVALYDVVGRQAGPTVFVDDKASFGPEYQSHEDQNAQELQAFLKTAERNLPGSEQPVFSEIYLSERKRTPLIALLTPVVSGGDMGLTLAVELSLDLLQKRFERFRVGREGFAFLIDGKGKLVFHLDRSRALQREDLQQFLPQGAASVTDYLDPERGEMLAAVAPVPGTDWTVVVAQPRREALLPVQDLLGRLSIGLGLGLLLALLFGLLLSSRITRPVRELVTGAKAIASGDLSHEIIVRGHDEIGRLGAAFAHMGRELRKQKDQIEAQTEEIKNWNRELQDRVEERTRELQQTQALLVQAQKMAAVGELGAGVAHEINNPLMGVMGSAQLLLLRHEADDPDHQLLADIERESRRIHTIVDKLLQASQTGRRGMARIALGNLVLQVVAALGDRFRQAKVRVEDGIPDDLPPILGNADQLEAVFTELFGNALRAMPAGGKLTLRGRGEEGKLLVLEVEDTGCGIPREHLDRVFEPFFTSKQDWQGQGLGLAMVFSAVSQHNGQIGVRSEPGQGTTFTLTFPALRRETHLR